MTYIGRDAESGWNFTIGNVIFSVRMVSPVIDLLDRKKINLHDKGEMDELKCVRVCVCVFTNSFCICCGANKVCLSEKSG